MSGLDVLSGRAWREWWLALAGPGVKRVSTGVALDPFGTSWRRLGTQARQWMTDIAAGQAVKREVRGPQVYSDLRGVGLVEPGSRTLTAFGQVVLQRWQTIPNDPNSGMSPNEQELALAVGLLDEALNHGVEPWTDYIAYWLDIAHVYGGDDTPLADPELLMLLGYLNQTRANINPWVAMRELQEPLGSPVDWEAIRDSIAGRDSTTDAAVDHVNKKLDVNRRGEARQVVCQAMSLVLASRLAPAEVPSRLKSIALP